MLLAQSSLFQRRNPKAIPVFFLYFDLKKSTLQIYIAPQGAMWIFWQKRWIFYNKQIFIQKRKPHPVLTKNTPNVAL